VTLLPIAPRSIAAGLLASVAAATALLIATPSWAQPKPEAPIPVEAFFERPALQSAALSPSGRWLAIQNIPKGGEFSQLTVIDQEGQEPSLVLAQFARAHVRGFTWLNDDLLIYWASEETATAVTATKQASSEAMFSVQRDGKRSRLLIKALFDTGYPEVGLGPLEANHQFLALGPAGTDEVIVGERLFGGSVSSLRPLVLNAKTGARRSLNRVDVPGARGWLFDHLGRARLAFVGDKGTRTILWQDLETGTWREIAKYEPTSPPFSPRFVDAANQLYVAVENASGTGEELRRFDFLTGHPEKIAVVATPGYDGAIAGIVARDKGELLGFRVLTDARDTVWLSSENQVLQTKVDAFLKGRSNHMRCARCSDLSRILVYSESDREPGDYLIYSPKTNEWRRVGQRRPQIDAKRMGTTELHRVKARDGLEIPVWVTSPPGPPQARPAVLLIHGGPWSRGREWDWNADAQFLASRGYLVIEPEFRGSTGYGDKLFRAGFRQWGQAMQDDVADALDFAVKKGAVDPKRVCIAGASYGGYATLMGLAKHPSLYKCGVAWVAVSDPSMMFSVHWSDISSSTKQYAYKTLIGDPEKDAAMFKASSPLAQAERIKAPLLMAYGSADARVPLVHGEKMRDALANLGRPPQYVVYDGEGHGWDSVKTRLDFWTRVEKFLAEHLGK
jgi:dipeptidyl aminopeptidase/acylaminoacyl peptidase